MRNIKPITAIALSAVLLMACMGFDCEKKGTPAQQKAEFIAYAKDINQAFITFGPIIAKDKPGLKAIWDHGTSIAGRVIIAVEASNSTEVIDLIAQLIPIVNEVVPEFTDNRTALIILAGADIGLHFFVNHYTPPEAAVSDARPTAGKARKLSTIEEFKARPAWGCEYKPKRCEGLRK